MIFSSINLRAKALPKRLVAALALCLSQAIAFSQSPRIIEADLCIYGGTSGGVAAAVQASRMGRRVVIIEPGRHLGGMTSGGLSAVDIGDPRTVGGIAREYFTRLVASYGQRLEWDKEFKSKGGGPATGGAYSIEPHVAEQVFDEMAKESHVPVHFNARLASVKKDGPRITELIMEDGTIFRAPMFIDATYEGDLMAKSGVTYTLMREGNAKYGETFNGIHYSPTFQPRTNHVKPRANGRTPSGQGVWDRDFPLDPYVIPGDPKSGLLPLIDASDPGHAGDPAPGVQAYCFRLCLTIAPDRIPITPPPDYDPKRYELIARFISACLSIGDDMDLRWFSKYDALPHDKWDFNTATLGGNLPGASWEWPEATYARREQIAQDHENYHRGLLHFLATDPRVPLKVREDMQRFGLPRDEFTDHGGWPHQLYIREARRMVSDLVMTEHHTFGRQIAPNSIGLGSYGTDTHEIRRIVKDGVVIREGKTAGGRGGAPPYPIGYAAIVPRQSECENLFVTFALSASHTAFSSIRMEPVFMVTSQSAATAACLALEDRVPVQKVDQPKLHARLLADHQVLEWNAAKPVAAPAPASKPQSTAPPTHETFIASTDWIPIHWEPARIVKDSALDFSSFLEAPAGKFGEVIIQNGRFIFKDAPDQPVRLYGTVVSHALPYLSKDQCDQFADYLAATGYNGVRLHNYNFAKGTMKEIGSAEFSPEAQDQLDYFFFSLKKRGIYFSFPLNAWGYFKAGDVTDVPEFKDRAFRFESNGLLPISHDLQNWFRDYSRRLLTHVNPYTGLALKDDPALVSIELTNENSLLSVLGQYPVFVPIYRRLCLDELRARLSREPSPAELEKELPEFVLHLQEKFDSSMKDYLRGLGVAKPLTDLNFRDNPVYAIQRSKLDYVDIHGYWALYKNLAGPKEGREAAFRQKWVNPNQVTWDAFLGPMTGRLFGKPYMNSEFNGSYPSPYWMFTGPVEAVIAAGQGWSGVFRCGIGADAKRFFNESALNRIETGPSPIMMFSERLGAMIFSQGEAAPLPVKIPMVVTPEYLLGKLDLTGGPKYPTSYQKLVFQYQIGTVLLDGHEHLDDYPCLVVPPDMKLPESLKGKKVLPATSTLSEDLKKIPPPHSESKTLGLQLDANTGTAQLITPRSETFLLPAETAQASGACLSITGNQSVSVCFTGSLDHQPLTKSRRLLALYLTDVKNSGTEIEREPADNVIVRHAGDLPLLVRQGKITMTFQLKRHVLPRIWALRYDGSRTQELQPHPTPNGFSFEATAVTNPETFSAFELIWD